jgi:ComF family protein
MVNLFFQSFMISTTIRSLSDFGDAILTVFYPTACRVCGAVIESRRDGIACSQCWAEIEQSCFPEDFCAKCGLPLRSLPPHIKINERHCGRCHDFAFNYARACGPYEGALRESVLRLKTHPEFPGRLRQILSETFAAAAELQAGESIIPVPLHPGRFAQRGFNQAEIIATALSSVTGLRVDTASIIRVKHTPRHRAGMGARERERSLNRSFRIRAPRLIENRAVLVVDDVMTTGSTAHEIAGTLLDGGARTVSILSLARATNEFN